MYGEHIDTSEVLITSDVNVSNCNKPKQAITNLEKVIVLLRVAENLRIINDKMFDNLMDKSELKSLYFEFIFESVNLHILEKRSVEDLMDTFLLFIKCDTFQDYQKESFFNSLKLFKSNSNL